MNVRRNYKVVGLGKNGDSYFVLILKKGSEDPLDTGLTVEEFVDPHELRPDGIFHYFTAEEKKILLRGVSKGGRDLDPNTRTIRKPDLPDGPLEDGTYLCRICRERKPEEEFSRYVSSKTGRRNYCKECASLRYRKSGKK